SLLSEISKARRLLETTKRYLAFLAVDVVKSSQMKEGEDEVAIGYSFMAYKKFVEPIMGKHSMWKQAWTPDGLMAAFHDMDQAVSAGQEILRRLEEFNQNHNQLKTPFSIRLGVHGGELYFDPSDKLEEVSDHVIDVAGHLQKEADTNALWTTLSDIEKLEEKSRFRGIEKKVGGHSVYEWRPTYSRDSSNDLPKGP
ncbi:MAG: guanylate cyclase, partial [Thermodesulfobacteriota bacterium]